VCGVGLVFSFGKLTVEAHSASQITIVISLSVYVPKTPQSQLISKVCTHRPSHHLCGSSLPVWYGLVRVANPPSEFRLVPSDLCHTLTPPPGFQVEEGTYPTYLPLTYPSNVKRPLPATPFIFSHRGRRSLQLPTSASTTPRAQRPSFHNPREIQLQFIAEPAPPGGNGAVAGASRRTEPVAAAGE